MQNKFNFQVLAEKGEIYKTSQGNLKQVSNKAPSHDDTTQVLPNGATKKAATGGVVLNDAHSVLSDSYTQVMNGDRDNSEAEQAVRISKREGNDYLQEMGFNGILKSSVSPSKFFLKAQEERDKQAKKLSSTYQGKDKFSFNSSQANKALLATLPTDEHLYEQVFQIQESKKRYADVDFDKMQFGGSTFPFTNMQKQNNISKEEKQYRNPEKKFETISTNDYALDFLYDNDWLLDTPIVGDYLKKKAKSIAEISDSPYRDTPDYNIKVDPTKGKRYSGEGLRMNQGTPQKTALVDVFFGDSKLPNSKYKPKSDYLKFLPSYSIKDEKDIDTNTLNTYIKQGFYGETDPKDVDKQFNSFLKNKAPIYRQYNEDNYFTLDVLNRNLGGHKEGIAWDEEKNLTYLSISDAWDFEPTNYSEKWTVRGDEEFKRRAYKQSYLLNKAGNPFKIYDRFYFDPKTKEYIPDEKLPKKQFGGTNEVSNPLFKYL